MQAKHHPQASVGGGALGWVAQSPARQHGCTQEGPQHVWHARRSLTQQMRHTPSLTQTLCPSAPSTRPSPSHPPPPHPPPPTWARSRGGGPGAGAEAVVRRRAHRSRGALERHAAQAELTAHEQKRGCGGGIEAAAAAAAAAEGAATVPRREGEPVRIPPAGECRMQPTATALIKAIAQAEESRWGGRACTIDGGSAQPQGSLLHPPAPCIGPGCFPLEIAAACSAVRGRARRNAARPCMTCRSLPARCAFTGGSQALQTVRPCTDLLSLHT